MFDEKPAILAKELIIEILEHRQDVLVSFNLWVPSITIKFRMDRNVHRAELDIITVADSLKDSGLISDFVYIFVAQTEIKRSGKITIESGVTVQLRPETVAKINLKENIELSSYADSYRVHPRL